MCVVYMKTGTDKGLSIDIAECNYVAAAHQD